MADEDEKEVKKHVTELKIDEVLADFFIKKIIKKKKSSLEKKKKHRKKTKHKHNHYSSSSISGYDSDSNNESKTKREKHKRKSSHHYSRSSSVDHNKKRLMPDLDEEKSKDQNFINHDSSFQNEKQRVKLMSGKETSPEGSKDHLSSQNSSKKTCKVEYNDVSVVHDEKFIPSEVHEEDHSTFGCSLPPDSITENSKNDSDRHHKTVISSINNEKHKDELDIAHRENSPPSAFGNASSVKDKIPDTKIANDAASSSHVITGNESSEQETNAKNDSSGKSTKQENLQKDFDSSKPKDNLSNNHDTTDNKKEKLEKSRHDSGSSPIERHEKRKKHSKKHSKDSSPKRSRYHHHHYDERHRERRGHSKDSTPERSRSSHHRYRHEQKKHRDRRSRDSSLDHDHREKTRKSSRDRYQSSHRSPSPNAQNKFDKAKLLAIARRNALSLLETGALPEVFHSEAVKKGISTTFKSGGKSVEELTEFCTALSRRENYPDDPSKEGNTLDDEMPFIRNPFKLRESSEIKLNIRNSVPIPIESHAEKVAKNVRALSQQFPVSSGDQHRQKELEWIPVEKEEEPKSTKAASSKQQGSVKSKNTSLTPQSVETLQPPPPPPMSTDVVSDPAAIATFQTSYPAICNQPVSQPEILVSSYDITIGQSPAPLTNSTDINDFITRRFKAIVRLNENPNDARARMDLEQAELQAQSWIQSQQVPGQFTGSTNAKFLTVQQLCGPHPVWVKKDTLTRAAPVTEGKGMSLLKKMGWNPGEGLGKNKEGTLEPLSINIKTDKKGFLAQGEGAPQNKPLPVLSDINKKHPVSILMELCSKRKWLPPTYTVVLESGPIHRRNFLFKVEVNNVEYKPAVSRPNKKQAKAECALVCLQALGVVSSDYKMV